MYLDPEAIVTGAEVAWITHGHFSGASATVGHVQRLTPTQIVVAVKGVRTPYRFSRKTGRMIGTYDRARLADPSHPAVISARAMGRARSALHAVETLARNASPKTLHEAYEELRKVWRVVDSAQLDVRNAIVIETEREGAQAL